MNYFYLLIAFSWFTQLSISGQEQNEMQIGHGTAIAIYLTTDEIAIAADSRISFGEVTSNAAYADTICKIKVYNNIVLAVAESYKAPFGFNISQIADKNLRGNELFQEKIDIMNRQVGIGLFNSYFNSKFIYPGFTKRYPMVEVDMAFAGIINNEMVLWRNKVVVDSNSTLRNPFNIDTLTNMQGSKDTSFIVFMGSLALADTLIRKNHKLINNKRRPVEYVRNAVEIAEIIPGVGGPIDILRITKIGTEWIQVKERCK